MISRLNHLQGGSAGAGSGLTPPLTHQDHRLGPAAGAVTLVEFGDYCCPYSRWAHKIVKDMLRRFRGHLHYCYRHFPVIDTHPYADEAAELAEVAAAGRMFWPMHELLYREAPDPLQLIDAAVRLRIDRVWVTTALRRHLFAERVQDNVASGLRSGVHSTPAFFINGEPLAGRWDERTLYEALEEAVHQASRVDQLD